LLQESTEVTQQLFRDVYAYSGRPLLVRNATNWWPATEAFTFTFFREIYESLNRYFDFHTFKYIFITYNDDKILVLFFTMMIRTVSSSLGSLTSSTICSKYFESRILFEVS